MENAVKVILAFLLFLCLLDWPYGYFQFVRFVAMVGFGFLAFQHFRDQNQTEMIIYIVLLIMFQPLIKISFGRELWNIIDVIVGAGLIISIFVRKTK